MTRRPRPVSTPLHRTPRDAGPVIEIKWTETTTTNHTMRIPRGELRALVERDGGYNVAAFDANPAALVGDVIELGPVDKALAARNAWPDYAPVDERTIDSVTAVGQTVKGDK